MLAQQERINQSLMSDGIEGNDLSQIPRTYTEGFYDGKIGLEVANPESWDYYSGWAVGHRIHECNKRGIELPDEF